MSDKKENKIEFLLNGVREELQEEARQQEQEEMARWREAEEERIQSEQEGIF